MRLKRRSFWSALAVILLVGAILPLATLQARSPAQGSAIQISVAMPDFNRDLFDALKTDFEAANPGVTLNFVPMSGGILSAAAGIDAHLDAYKGYANSADVLYVDINRISPEATRAGYFLDLAPLVAEDKTLNADDFYPTVWQSFQWDKGVWALPTSTDVQILTYDPAAFDKAGIAYPADTWTLDDLDTAVRKLAEKDADGKIVTHGIDLQGNYAKTILFRSLLGEGLFDPNTIPNPPQIDKPAAETLLDKWYQIDKDGLVGSELNVAPLSVNPAFTLLLQLDPNKKRAGVMLPGGKAGLDTQGYGVSAGTTHPEQAYALARFLTTRAELGSRFAATPARQSLATATGTNPRGPNIRITPEVQALVDKGIANGIPVSEMRYTDYMAIALEKMKTGVDSKGALQSVESQATASLQTAADKKGNVVLVVPTPIPTPEIGAGKIALKFGITSFVRQLPHKDAWDKLIADFTANDPQVAQVTLETGFNLVDQAAAKYDCFYVSYNGVPNAKLEGLLNLDPFFAADTSFDKNDVVGNVMSQLTRDNKVWALPVDVEPSILKYDSAQFSKAGAVAPGLRWNIDAFNDAVKVLKPNPTDPAPFVASNAGGVHLLILMAAYGGLPLDYRTSPVTINYTDPKTVDAIRQVLDLAKNGYIKYEELAGTGFRAFAGGRPNTEANIYTEALNAFSARQNVAQTTSSQDTYKPTTYPRGTQFSAISYGIGTAYISSKSQNPEACYRWISLLSRHPELFDVMPARHSLINDPTIAANQGPDVTALYNEIDTLLKDPNTLSFPSLFSGITNPTGFLYQYWLFQAFDNYVLKNGDLEAKLKDAEGYAKGFQECVVNIPPFDPSSQDTIRQYLKAFGDCATKVDPSLKPLFALIGG